MTAAYYQSLATEAREATAHVYGITTQARLRGLTTETHHTPGFGDTK